MVKIKAERRPRAAIDGSASLIRINVLAFVCILFVCADVHTPVQLCLISALSGNHRVTLQGPFLRHVPQEHIVVAACFP